MLDWIYSCIRGKLEGSVPRRTGKEYCLKGFDELCWVADYKTLKNPGIPYVYDSVTPDLYDSAIAAPIECINDKNDCADFKALRLVQLAFETKDFLSANPFLFEKIKNCLTGFSFWIEDSRNDSMCYYSENHQICFATVEYLSGMLFPDALFSCDKKNGREHMKRAENRIETWYSLRREFGFSEFMSNNYLPIDVAALSVLLMHSKNHIREIAEGSLDILMDCYASGFFKGTFINASGRDYPGNLAGTAKRSANSLIIATTSFVEKEKYLYETGKASTLFVKAVADGYYKVPAPAVKYAFEDTDEVRRFGLDTADYKKHGLLKGDTRSLMMQLGSGALTNPAIINQTYGTIERLHLWHHDFVHWLRFIDMPVLRRLGLMPICSRILDYFQNGMSLESADVHTIRTKHYKISVLEDYFPGSFGAQKNTLAITLDNKTPFFINHPLRPCPEGGPTDFPLDEAGAPSYFAGYNTAPAAVACSDTVLMIYRLPRVRGVYAPCSALHFTHAYFDKERYDETVLESNYLFARAGESFMALIGRNAFEMSSPDLVQQGRNVYWIIVLSDTEKESFGDFVARIRAVPVSFDGFTLKFGTKKLTYKRRRP